MNWNYITKESDIDDLVELSNTKKVVVFKHSTRCSISKLVLNRFEQSWTYTDVAPYLIDLLSYRQISNKISELFDVVHQSPQLLVIVNGKCVDDASHSLISSINLNA
jgi:bacillithiol system protein YtxJ